MENSRINLYKERDFGEVFNATFDFIKQEFKPLGRAILVFILPFILLQGIFMAYYQNSIFSLLKDPEILRNGIFEFWSTFFSSYLLLMVVMVLVQTIIYSTILSYLRLYNRSEEEITVPALANEIKNLFFPVLGAIVLTMLVLMVGLMMCVLPGLYLGVSLSLFLIALGMEKKGIGDAFSRSFQLVHMQWGWTFLLILVVFVLLYIASVILQIPSMILGFTFLFHSIQEGTNPMEGFGSGYIIYTSIISAIQQILYILPILLLAFHYFSLVEIREKTSLNKKIDALGQNE